jgi:hypothetical protein
MKRQLRTIVPVFVLALALAAVAGAAPAYQASSADANPKIATGELQKVDTTSQTFAIKQPSGDEMQFTYTNDTKVEGAQTTMQGLASETGNKVTVHYTEKGGNKIATSIEVTKK